MLKYRFITENEYVGFCKPPIKKEVLQVEDRYDRNGHDLSSIHPNMQPYWRNATRWEAEELLRELNK